MTAKYNVYKVTDPITKLTYDDEFGYYVAPEDIEESIKQRVQNNNFDHIFIVMKLRRWTTPKWYSNKWLDRTSVQWTIME